MKKLIFLISFFTASCSQNYFYVQKEKINKTHLASSHVHTPDPRQYNPPEGDALLIRWDFPLSVFEENPSLIARVRFFDGSEEIMIRPILRKRDSCSIFFENQHILTYLIQAKSEKGEILSQWEHQFWTEWIGMDDPDREPSAQSRRASVSSQPRQESVTETP